MTHTPRRNATALLVLAAIVGITAAAPAAASAENRIFPAAGNGALGFGGDGGPAPQAALNHPRGLVVMPDGGYLIADAGGHRVRRVFPNGTITTVAGTGVAGYSGDGGPATAARLDLPHAVAPLPDGSFLIADTRNHRIRKVSPNGIITTVAGVATKGFSGDGGPATAARITDPRGLDSLPDGSYLIPDTDNNRIRKVSPTGIITTVAGTGTSGFDGDGGAAISAALNSPFGVSALSGGGFLISDTDNRRVRRVTADGRIATVAGVGVTGFSGDGGSATAAQIAPPYNTAALPDGSFLIADTANNRVRRVSPLGTITTVAGQGPAGSSGDGELATNARLNNPKAVFAFGSGFLIADSENNRVRQVRQVAGCVDRSRPRSSYSRASRKTTRRGRVTLRGTARDRSCGAAKVSRVQVSIGRAQGRGRCRHLGSSGRLGRATSCAKRKFLRARAKSLGGGRARWSFKVRRRLPPGRYVAQIRAIDKSNNTERRRRRGASRNVISFRVR